MFWVRGSCGSKALVQIVGGGKWQGEGQEAGECEVAGARHLHVRIFMKPFSASR